MSSLHITSIEVDDRRFRLDDGAGSDAVHCQPVYSYAVTRLCTASSMAGNGLAFTLGAGNDLVCRAICSLAEPLRGQCIEDVMAEFGAVFGRLADHPQLRWLGPHKGVVHLALASITNACFDLWAKSRGVPLWKLLLDLPPNGVLSLLDLSYLEDILTADDVIQILMKEQSEREQRRAILCRGYRAYDTSIGWYRYDDRRLRENVKRALAEGFRAFKLKVGSRNGERDLRRAFDLREMAGPEVPIMLDANQQWSPVRALQVCAEMIPMAPYWIEEPTHPDDVFGHQTLARAIAPIPVAVGEHIPNRVVFKNFLQAGAAGILQVDCTRVGGVSEFLTVCLLARKCGVPVAPHVGDMGQIHQHLVLFNHIALGHPELFLEHIPHLKDQFVDPARVADGVYRTPEMPGSSCELKRSL